MLDGILPAPRGVPQIEVTFDIDANGIVNVAARDQGTGKEQKITITASSGLSDAEVEQMVADAEEHAEEDQKRREAVELRNTADSSVFAAEKLIQENEDSIPVETKTDIEGKIKATRDAIEADDTDSIRSAMEELNSALQQMGEVVYGQGNAGASEASEDVHSQNESSDEDADDGAVEGAVSYTHLTLPTKA